MPNNWLSEFGGSAWQYDDATGQYYYHAFLAAQPDLNWRNPAVRQAIYDVMRFWLAKGVDGFRVDVIWHLVKDATFCDNPPNPHYVDGRPPHERILTRYSTDQPEVQEVVAEMRRVTDEFDARVLIGEIYLPLHRLVAYYGNDLGGAHMPFNFALLSTLWSARSIERIIAEYEAALPPGAWPNWVLGNHDRPRVASRVGPDQARVAAMLLLTLRGTPTLYYGDEIGMRQVTIAPHEVRDPFEKNVPGIGVGRDGCRTPMQWDATDGAGFSNAKPWLPLADDYRRENVAALDADAALDSQALPGADCAQKEIAATGEGRLPADCSGGRYPALPPRRRRRRAGDRAEPRREAGLDRLQLDRRWPRNPAVDLPRSAGRGGGRHARAARE